MKSKRDRRSQPWRLPEISTRALNFNFKGWRENHNLTDFRAAFILGANVACYRRYEAQSQAPVLSVIVLARLYDYLCMLKKTDAAAFLAFWEAAEKVESLAIAPLEELKNNYVAAEARRQRRLRRR